MKKIKFIFASALLAVMLCLSISVLAMDEVHLPTFDVKFNDTEVDSYNRQYPLLVYKDITYFPLTFNDCRYLGLSTTWDNDTRTLSISKSGVSAAYRDYYSETPNDPVQYMLINTFNIVVNGKKIDNSTEEYPFLIYRDVTYFPLTWRFAVEEFGWAYNFDEKSGLAIFSDNRPLRRLELPNLGGSMSVATDKNYYYYTGNENNIYRVKCDDFSAPEIIHTLPENPDYNVTSVTFSEFDGSVFFSYHIGGPSMGTSYRYKINSDGTVEKSDEGSHLSAYVGGNTYFYDGERVDALIATQGHTGSSTAYYTVGEITTEIHLDTVVFGEYKIGEKSGFNSLYIYEDKIYITGYEGDENSALYCVDTAMGSITKLCDNVGIFYGYFGYDRDTAKEGVMIIFDYEGNRYRYSTVEGHLRVIEENVPNMVLGTGRGTVGIAQDDGKTASVTFYDSYASGLGSIHTTPFVSDAACEFTKMGDYIVVKQLESKNVRLAVIDTYMDYYFKTSEMPKNVFIYGNTLIFTSCENEDFVVEVKLYDM